MKQNKIFWAVIIGAFIIGAGLYFGLQKTETALAPKLVAPILVQNQPQNTAPVGKINSVAATCGVAENTIVTKVIDGDTVVVEGGWHVRLLGMDADEKGYPCYTSAKTRLENLVLSKQIILEKDVSNVDQYGRCLRYIFLGSMNIDTQLVKEGLAVARFYQPDIKYRAEITSAENYAQQNKVGCKWSGLSQTTN